MGMAKATRLGFPPPDLLNEYAGLAQVLDLMAGDRPASIQLYHTPTQAESWVIGATIEAPGGAPEHLGLGQGETLVHAGGMRA
jgi:hypothetical protein